MLSHRAIRTFEQRAPSTALTMRSYLERRRGEPELRLAIELTSTCRTAIDIGANRGVYAYWLARQARRCVAFEPNPECADLLQRALGSRIEVHHVALSNEAGDATLSIPISAGRENSYRSSLETGSRDQHRAVSVTTATLDSFTLSEVDFIKVDVEGHEIEALAGGSETIGRHQPTVLVEAEERHREGSVETVRNQFTRFGYRGFFLFNDQAMDIDDFDPTVHQVEPEALGARTATYANNFIFVPPHRTEQIDILEQRR